MNLPPGSRVIIDRTNEPNHSPGELVLLVEAPGLEVDARHNELSGDYILHGSVVRGSGRRSDTIGSSDMDSPWATILA